MTTTAEGSELIEFKDGKTVAGRWKVLGKLGFGGCGAVYAVADLKRKPLAKTTNWRETSEPYGVALKVEATNLEDGGVLKLEAEVLKKLAKTPNCVRLIHSGKRANYSFIVMDLMGKDLMALKGIVTDQLPPPQFGRAPVDRLSESTILRVAVHSLYAIKQLHEIGYIHRDVKPGNMVTGFAGRDRRVIYLIDYGMVRSFVVRPTDSGSQSSLRPKRFKILLRGTLRYCSLVVHQRQEQGRVDDLWSLMYMLIELHAGLPWRELRDERKLEELKVKTDFKTLLVNCPPEFLRCLEHLDTLRYEHRPDYKLLYDAFMDGLRRLKSNFRDRYDWETGAEADLNTAVEFSKSEKPNQKPGADERLDWQLYPTTHPKHFKEVKLRI